MRRQHAAAALLFSGLAVAMTWPLAWNLDRAVSDFTDPYLNIWILDWDWWATLHQPLSLFHASSLYPAQYSLAFSENLYGIALLLFPLRAIGVGPIAAYNVAMLLGFAFCGFAAYLLGFQLTRSWSAGIAAGVFYAFVPFRFEHITHVQHVWGGWLPLLLVTVLWYGGRASRLPAPGVSPDATAPGTAAGQDARPRAGRMPALLFGAVFVMNGLTNIHYLLFGAFAAGVTALLLVPRRAWRELAIATGVAMVLLAPFLYPYAAVAKLYGHQRTAAESVMYSAMPVDWIARNATQPELRVFPGVLAFIAIAAALLLAWRQWQKLVLAGLWIAIGFAGSLGMNFEFHRFLFGGVPGFRAIRAPARWAVIAYVGIAILIALATAAIARRNRWLALIVPAAFVVELWAAPIRWYLAVPEPPPVYRWLARGRTPIAELPFSVFGSEYLYHLRATTHHRPMVSGIEWTPVRGELVAKWSATPIGEDFVDALERIGVDTVVVHTDRFFDRADVIREWMQREKRLQFVTQFGDDLVFRVGVRSKVESATFNFRPDPSHSFVAPTAPVWGEKVRGKLIVAGWAGSPHGIQYANVYFNNRTIRERIEVEKVMRGAVPEYRFFHVFPARPDGVWRDTDVQIDAVDGRGNAISSEDRWFRWE